MKLIWRLFSFTGVGFIATAAHSISLVGLSLISLPISTANAISFTAGFIVSFGLQQKYTFKDRLAGSKLSRLAGCILFSINLGASALLGEFLGKDRAFILPLAPAVINYVLYYNMTGAYKFKRKGRAGTF